MPFEVPEQKQIRVIINTDAKCEADDQYAIVHAILSPRLKIKGIIGAHFGTRSSTGAEDSYQEVLHLLDLMHMKDKFRVVKGANHKIPDTLTPVSSNGADLIIEEAMKDDPLPLFVTFQGPLTDLASAYLKEPRIAERLTAIWIGGGTYPDGDVEFNLSNDIEAAQVVFNSPIHVWQVPKNVYDMVRVGLAELAVKVRPYGEIGKYLYEYLIQHNMKNGDRPQWPKGEIWVLGDSPATSLLLDDQAFDYDLIEAPNIHSDMSYQHKAGNRKIRVYRSVDSRFILEDFYAKLSLFANPQGC
ncbi:nucleoside hydrolase [Paenibacillus sp. CGMCC 1.16610]|uniref:Nucleoside hydrolase n=2 Tax=Paenibacillus TaxID=44249 RepID=A0ABW9U670_9BACL|nr:nucleoside hydrolase [Paenibacillus sp. CGMCC 1.16610]MVQ34912.1 nucleoside hydrolase [Paenibacillus anseongense]